MFLFPFNNVPQRSNIVLYGAGTVCKDYLQQIKALDWCNVLYAVDKQYRDIHFTGNNINVLSPNNLRDTDFDCLVVAANGENRDGILEDIEELQLSHITIIDNVIYLTNIDSIPTFSQFGEDLVIIDIFHRLGIEKPSYIDVGAHHPYAINNTALLHRNGSRGINVEANPDYIAAFYKARPQDININTAVGVICGTFTFYRVGPIYTLSYDLAERWQKRNSSENLTIENLGKIPVTTLTNIVNEYSEGIYPDFMDIDIEGLDYDVLKSSDFSNGKPLVICAEMSGEKADIMMREKGYYRYIALGCNTIYIREEISDCLRIKTVY